MIAPCRKPACRLARLDGSPGRSDPAAAAAAAGAARNWAWPNCAMCFSLPQSTVSRHLKVLLRRRVAAKPPAGHHPAVPHGRDGIRSGRRQPLWPLAREQSDAWPTARQEDVAAGPAPARKAVRQPGLFCGRGGRVGQASRRTVRVRMESAGPAGPACRDSGWSRTWAAGPAGSAAELAPNVARVIGVDNSADMLRAARRRVGELPMWSCAAAISKRCRWKMPPAMRPCCCWR